MTPRQRLSAQFDALPRWQRLLMTGAALVGAVIAITGPIVSGAGVIDARYVKQHAYDSTRVTDSIVQQGAHTIDSLKHQHELEKIDTKLARMDSSVACLRRRKPVWCE